LAAWKRLPACAVFPSGWHANTGVLPALLSSDDTVVLDRLAHASLVDGARLSKAKLLVFAHNDPDDLDRVLRRVSGEGRRWVVTESVFSMDGDVAPLCELIFTAERHGAQMYVDEAHAVGVFGAEGRGVVGGLGLEKRIPVSMGTLSKALGSQGGYVAGSSDLIRWIHNKARAFIYSTALAPASVGAALAAVALVRAADDRRRRVLVSAGRLRDGLSRLESTRICRPFGGPYASYERGPIVPFVVGDAARAVEVSRRLWDAGFYAPAVRPPTVPEGTSRLRFSVTAGHTDEDVDQLVQALASAL
jgi:8-amino-7-oxononanoate synthase